MLDSFHSREINTEELKSKIWKQLRDGMSAANVAKNLGIDQRTVSKHKNEVLRELRDAYKADSEIYVQEELEFLENLYDTVHNKLLPALDDSMMLANEKAVAVASNLIARLLQIRNARIQLLGLNAPTKLEQKVDLNVEKELNNALQKLESKLDPATFDQVLKTIASLDE